MTTIYLCNILCYQIASASLVITEILVKRSHVRAAFGFGSFRKSIRISAKTDCLVHVPRRIRTLRFVTTIRPLRVREYRFSPIRPPDKNAASAIKLADSVKNVREYGPRF